MRGHLCSLREQKVGVKRTPGLQVMLLITNTAKGNEHDLFIRQLLNKQTENFTLDTLFSPCHTRRSNCSSLELFQGRVRGALLL